MEPLFFYVYSTLETFNALHLVGELILPAAFSFECLSWRPLSFLFCGDHRREHEHVQFSSAKFPTTSPFARGRPAMPPPASVLRSPPLEAVWPGRNGDGHHLKRATKDRFRNIHRASVPSPLGCGLSLSPDAQGVVDLVIFFIRRGMALKLNTSLSRARAEKPGQIVHRVRKFVEVGSGRIGYAMTETALAEVSNGAKWDSDHSFSVADAILADPEFASVLKVVLRDGHVLVPAPKAKGK
jgi:hypothetical protein